MDKKSFISKVTEPNELFQTLIMDVMMYCKYKIKTGVSFEGLVELLKKVKISLLKIISSPEFLR